MRPRPALAVGFAFALGCGTDDFASADAAADGGGDVARPDSAPVTDSSVADAPIDALADAWAPPPALDCTTKKFLFCTTFEEASFPPAPLATSTLNGNLVVTTSTFVTKTHSMYGTLASTSVQANAYGTYAYLDTGASNVYTISLAFKAESLKDLVDVAEISYLSGPKPIGIGVELDPAGSQVRAWVRGTSGSGSTSQLGTFSYGVWHYLALHLVVGGASSARLDGTTVPLLSIGAPNDNARSFLFGMRRAAGGGASALYVDDVAVSSF